MSPLSISWNSKRRLSPKKLRRPRQGQDITDMLHRVDDGGAMVIREVTPNFVACCMKIVACDRQRRGQMRDH